MNVGVVSIAAGGFLLGGAYSIARLERDGARRGRGQILLAVALAVLALYLIAVGVFRLVMQ